MLETSKTRKILTLGWTLPTESQARAKVAAMIHRALSVTMTPHPTAAGHWAVNATFAHEDNAFDDGAPKLPFGEAARLVGAIIAAFSISLPLWITIGGWA